MRDDGGLRSCFHAAQGELRQLQHSLMKTSNKEISLVKLTMCPQLRGKSTPVSLASFTVDFTVKTKPSGRLIILSPWNWRHFIYNSCVA